MGLFSVVLAAVAAWLFGAVWYGVIGKQWMAASGLTEANIDRKNPIPYIGSFLCTLVVAGMTRHIMIMAGIAGIFSGIITGIGLGLFIAAPWIVTNVLFSQRPKELIWMDGTYPVIGMALMGLVLTIF